MTTTATVDTKRSSVSYSPEKSLHFAADSKFFCRLLSKASLDRPSLHFYDDGITAVAVPFRWELHPGTPKHYATSDTLPPLTPPPSSSLNHGKRGGAQSRKKRSFFARSNLFFSVVLVKLRIKKTKFHSTYCYSSSSSSSSGHNPMLTCRLPSSRSSSSDYDGYVPRRRACGCFGMVLLKK